MLKETCAPFVRHFIGRQKELGEKYQSSALVLHSRDEMGLGF
jgi:hypothetical protein